MRDVELALQQLELAQRELVGENPSDFNSLERLGRDWGLAIDAVLELIENPGLTAEQLDRLKRVHVSGILCVERIRGARQAVREELSRLSQQGRVLSGYQSGSTPEFTLGSTTQS